MKALIGTLEPVGPLRAESRVGAAVSIVTGVVVTAVMVGDVLLVTMPFAAIVTVKASLFVRPVVSDFKTMK